MEKKRLLETLKQLQDELAQTEGVDPDTRAQLEVLSAEIRRALEHHGEMPAEEVEPATSGLKDLLLRYEAEHPQLANSIGRVADALAAMGF